MSKRTESKKGTHRHVLLTISRIQQNVYKSQIATITLNVWNVDCDVVGTAFAHSQWILIALERKKQAKKALKKDKDDFVTDTTPQSYIFFNTIRFSLSLQY